MAAILFETGLMLAALVVGGTIAQRLSQSVIPFYVVSGMLMSPFVLGRLGYSPVSAYAIELQEYITLLAELGIVFLLFFLEPVRKTSPDDVIKP